MREGGREGGMHDGGREKQRWGWGLRLLREIV